MTRRDLFAESRCPSAAVSNAVKVNKDVEGFEYAEEDMQVPMFSSFNSKISQQSSRRLSCRSIESSDSMSLIVEDKELWKEFQDRLKQSKCVTGAICNTKEVLREFIKEKGLDEECRKEVQVSVFRASFIVSQHKPYLCMCPLQLYLCLLSKYPLRAVSLTQLISFYSHTG